MLSRPTFCSGCITNSLGLCVGFQEFKSFLIVLGPAM
jgi:hypothetical protein